MSLVARAYPDPQFIDADGRVLADTVAIRSPEGDVVAGELVLRRRSAFPLPTRLDEAVARAGFRRSGAWHRCPGGVGDEWEAEVVTSGAREPRPRAEAGR